MDRRVVVREGAMFWCAGVIRHAFPIVLLTGQSFAARQKWQYTTLGQFKHSLHFIVSLPSDVLLTEFLTTTMEKLLKQVVVASSCEAGLNSSRPRRPWLVAGCPC